MSSSIQSSDNNLDKFFTTDPKAFAMEYLNYLQSILSTIDTNEVSQFIKELLDAREKKSTVFFIGNGGSAATASHFANDLAFGTNDYENPFRVISLTDNTPVVTALANDYGYDEIFIRQLRVYAKQGDVLVGISASGNSPNMVNAFNYASKSGIKTIAITAFDGGEMKRIADNSIHVPTEKGEYGPAEDVHMVLDHLVSTYLMRLIKNV